MSEAVDRRHPWRRILPLLKPYRSAVVLAPLLMVLEVVMDLLQPRFLMLIVDQGIARLDMGAVLGTGAIMLAVAVVGAVGGVGCTIYAVRASQGIGADLRVALFRKVQGLSVGNLDRLRTGRLVTRLTNDVTQIQEIVLMVLRIMIRAPLMLLGSLVMAVATSPRLALVIVTVVPVLAVVLGVVTARSRGLFAGVQRRLDELNTMIQENLAGVRVVKAFVRSQHETGRFERANEDLTGQTARVMRLNSVVMPVNMLLLNLAIVVALWIGGVRVVAGDMTVGQIMAFVNYLLRTLVSLTMVGMLIVRLSRALASADRIDEVLGSEPDVRPPLVPRRLDGARGRVEFRGVSFGYDGAAVLREVSFVVEPGEKVAVLGATGSGKSTLVNLIPRFYDASSGSVLLDGVDVREIDEESLRRAVAVAMQDTVLFSGTIAGNIRYARPEATDEEVVQVARAAQAEEFVSRFPEGYATAVGQRGVGLSGGQRQRVSRGRCSRGRRCWCWTTARAPWTRIRRRRSWTFCARGATARPCSWSPSA